MTVLVPTSFVSCLKVHVWLIEMDLLWLFGKTTPNTRARELLTQTKSSRACLWFMVVVVICGISWSRWAEIDQLTRAPATVIASSKTKVVQSPDPGIVESILVSEGDRVGDGQTLLILDTTFTESAVEELQAELANKLATRARLEAEIAGDTKIRFPVELAQYPRFRQNQRDLFAQRRLTVSDEIDSLSASMGSVQQELNLLRPLVRTGDVSQTEVIRLERQLSELEGRLTGIRNKFRSDAAAQMDEVDGEIASLAQRLKQRENQLAKTSLTSPVNGIVKSLLVNTMGAVVGPGEVLLEIVPVEDNLVIEAKISPSEIAFVRSGMDAVVKIDAYDYTIYGELRGVLTYISADTLVERSAGRDVPYYRAQVTIKGPRFTGYAGGSLEILPGMSAVVEIKTGKSTVFNYLAKPVVKTLSESFTDR